jgi:hypothetical protein
LDKQRLKTIDEKKAVCYGMQLLFKLLAAVSVFLLFFYSTTIAMSLLYPLDVAPLPF